MNEQLALRPALAGGGAPSATGENPDSLPQLERQARSFQDAARAAIQAALSGDSAAFLQAQRQSGGQ